MSTRIYPVFKKIVWGPVDPNEKILEFNNPDSPNAVGYINPSDNTAITLNQTFKAFSILNDTLVDLFVSPHIHVPAIDTAVNGVFIVLPGERISLELGVAALRVYLNGAGSIYLTLY